MLYPITVVNKYHGAKGEYIGRGSPLGNPFPLGNFVNRNDCVEAYKTYIVNAVVQNTEHGNMLRKEFIRLHKLAQQGPLNLVCFCAPLKCHGEIIKQILEEK